MPRRNLIVLLSVTLVALLCYQRVQKNPYGRVLEDAISKVEQDYLEPIQALDLFEGAMDGMLGRLDPNSIYIAPAHLQEFHDNIELQFVGVGMQLTLDPQTRQLIVLSPLVGSPAYKAGIRAGDRILRIGGDSTQGMSLSDAVGLLRGKPGEPVKVTVLHEKQERPVEITMIRGRIQGDSVLGYTRNPDGAWNFSLEGHERIGYVRIGSFNDKTAGELRNALERLSDRKLRGLVLDLRDDPGGYVDAAVEVCDMLIPSGVIVTTRRRDGLISRTYSATGRGRFTDFPIAVLVNDQSASAAEIVAACLQDHRRAVVVGQRTFGKGTIQQVIPLEEGCGAMKLTTASYWRPSGKDINRGKKSDAKADWGVSPDEGFQVALTNEEQSRWRQWRTRREIFPPSANHDAPKNNIEPFVDRPLDRAVEYLEKQAAGK